MQMNISLKLPTTTVITNNNYKVLMIHTVNMQYVDPDCGDLILFMILRDTIRKYIWEEMLIRRRRIMKEFMMFCQVGLTVDLTP